MTYPITTQVQIRKIFWEQHPDLSKQKVNGDYVADTRCAFVDFVDYLARDGQISAALAGRATL